MYVLTANPVIKRVEEALNALVNSNARPGGDPRAKGGPKPPPKQTALQQGNAGGGRFAMQDTVRFVPKGTKLATIDAIIKSEALRSWERTQSSENVCTTRVNKKHEPRTHRRSQFLDFFPRRLIVPSFARAI